MKILVVGSGAREHALCWGIRKSPLCSKLYCAPGNFGISGIAERVDIKANDVESLVQFAIDKEIDFVVVGPEEPLVNGLVDSLTANNILAFGPTSQAAVIEGSKTFMKELCSKYDIPTAGYEKFNNTLDAASFVTQQNRPLVVKASGLAAGKGVVLCENQLDALRAIGQIMVEKEFGDAGTEIIIEEYLQGEEASFFAFVNGATVVPLSTAQDHKRAFDGDEGPNTGGMGAYSPAPIITPALYQEIMETVMLPTAEAMVFEGRSYSGLLYAGIMVTKDGPKVLEFNARFGDPECQPLIYRLKSDLLEALLACARNELDTLKLEWYDDPALTVVMAAKGYPGSYQKGTVIAGIGTANQMPGVAVFHAGTELVDGQIVSTGGRVLSVTARGSTIQEAQQRAYAGVERITWPDGFYRKDIGWRAISR